MTRWIGGDSKGNGNDQYTKVLLHLDGNLNDTNFGGSSHTWSTVASATTSDTAKFGSNAAGFPNTPTLPANCHTTAANTDFNLGSSDFTIDFWMRTDVTLLGQAPTAGQRGGSDFSWFTYAGPAVGGMLVGGTVSKSTGGTAFVESGGFSGGSSYHHVALVRHGTSLMISADGVFGTPATLSDPITASTGNLSIGRAGSLATGNGWNGAIDEFRLTVGLARWTSNFTPPTIPYSRFIGSSI